MKKIPLYGLPKGTLRGYAIVDDDDYDWLMKFNWNMVTGHSGVHYARNWYGQMHRLILIRGSSKVIEKEGL